MRKDGSRGAETPSAGAAEPGGVHCPGGYRQWVEGGERRRGALEESAAIRPKLVDFEEHYLNVATVGRA